MHQALQESGAVPNDVILACDAVFEILLFGHVMFNIDFQYVQGTISI